jgi:quinol monooxygenase YgiN
VASAGVETTATRPPHHRRCTQGDWWSGASVATAVGCLDVAICADLVDPGRVNIFERWESEAALETFRSSGADTEQRRATLTVSVQECDIADVREGCGT